jgi:putative transposase
LVELSQAERVRLVDINDDQVSVRKQCSLLAVPRATVYYKPKPRVDDTILANEIHEIWVEMPFYGYRRITAELQRRRYDINRKKVARIMCEMNIKALYPKMNLSKRNMAHKIHPYLLKDLEIKRPNQVWCCDITYIKVIGGFIYLVALIDVFSRFVVAWCISNSLDIDFCLRMLRDGFAIARPEILNTDQGSQFTSDDWVSLVKENGVRVSMDGRGRWADNIYIERFWRTLKHEHIFLHDFTSVKEAKLSIDRFIEMYNNRRLHQSLGYKTPAEVYHQLC